MADAPGTFNLMDGLPARPADDVYMDNNATTAGGPGGGGHHAAAADRALRQPVEHARLRRPGRRGRGRPPASRCRALLNAAAPSEIVFTSGGSESDNLAIVGTLHANPRKRHLVTTAVEHPAVLGLCRDLEKRHGYEVDLRGGRRRWAAWTWTSCATPCATDTAVVSVMMANNETGVLFDTAAIGAHRQGEGRGLPRGRGAGGGQAAAGPAAAGHGRPALPLRPQAARAQGRRRPLRAQGHQVPPPDRGRATRSGAAAPAPRTWPPSPAWARPATWPAPTSTDENTTVRALRDRLEDGAAGAHPRLPAQRRPATAACPTPRTSASSTSRARASCCCWTGPAWPPAAVRPAPAAASSPATCCGPWASPSPPPTARSASPCRATTPTDAGRLRGRGPAADRRTAAPDHALQRAEGDLLAVRARPHPGMDMTNDRPDACGDPAGLLHASLLDTHGGRGPPGGRREGWSPPCASPAAGARVLTGLHGGAGAALLAAWRARTGRAALVVTADRESAVQLADDLETWLGPGAVIYLPQQEVLAFDHNSPEPVHDRRRRRGPGAPAPGGGAPGGDLPGGAAAAGHGPGHPGPGHHPAEGGPAPGHGRPGRRPGPPGLPARGHGGQGGRLRPPRRADGHLHPRRAAPARGVLRRRDRLGAPLRRGEPAHHRAGPGGDGAAGQPPARGRGGHPGLPGPGGGGDAGRRREGRRRPGGPAGAAGGPPGRPGPGDLPALAGAHRAGGRLPARGRDRVLAGSGEAGRAVGPDGRRAAPPAGGAPGPGTRAARLRRAGGARRPPGPPGPGARLPGARLDRRRRPGPLAGPAGGRGAGLRRHRPAAARRRRGRPGGGTAPARGRGPGGLPALRQPGPGRPPGRAAGGGRRPGPAHGAPGGRPVGRLRLARGEAGLPDRPRVLPALPAAGPGPPPQQRPGQGAGVAAAGRVRGAPGVRHRPVQGPAGDHRRGRGAGVPAAGVRRRRQGLRAGGEHRPGGALQLRPGGQPAPGAPGLGQLAEGQGQGPQGHPRHGGRADRALRRAPGPARATPTRPTRPCSGPWRTRSCGPRPRTS